MSTSNDDKIPGGHVIGVISGDTAAANAAEELERHGFVSTHLYRGEELHDKADSSGFVSKVLRSVQDHLSEQTNFLVQYEEEARQGNTVLAVKTDGQEEAEVASAILEAHGAHNVRYFGRLAVADMTPATNPTARSAESPEAKNWSGT